MNETGKTFAFLGAGVAALAVAFLVAGRDQQYDVQSLVGEQLNEFDVEAPRSLRIVKLDPESSGLREFEVAEQDGVWSIPSKQGYPADAISQMAEAATCLMNREDLARPERVMQDHVDLGVVDPMAAESSADPEGAGTRVIMKDGSEEVLVDMIIGKEVKDSEDQRYVRKATQDVVYVVELDPEKLTTEFEQWIEDDLLQLNTFDMRRIFINDYSAEMGLVLTPNGFSHQIDWDRRGQFTFDYDSDDSKWLPESLKEFDPAAKQMVEFKLGEDEEVNEDSLREMRNGLDDLLIVDVERKPTGLSSDLKAGADFVKDRAAMENLIERGFAPVKVNGEDEILSSEGEVICTMQNGVEYVLRFGKLQIGEDATASDAASADADEDAENGADSSINRYLFVMARFNESAIERPDIKELPALPDGATLPETTQTPGDSEADDSAGGDAAVEEEEEEDDAGEDDADTAAEQTSTDDEADSTDAAEPTGEESAADAPANEEQSDSTDEPTDGATDDSGEAADSDESELEKLIAERKSVEQENQRLLDEYQEKIEEGKERTAELNERFGDWYYVISNDVYKQIHLGREQLFKPKEQEESDGDDSQPASSTNDVLSGLPALPFGDAQEPSDDGAATSENASTTPEAVTEIKPEEPPLQPATADAAESTANAAEVGSEAAGDSADAGDQDETESDDAGDNP